MAKFLCICVGLTKFKENPEGSSIFCVDLTWNDPFGKDRYIAKLYGVAVQSQIFFFFFGGGGGGGEEEELELCKAPPHLMEL